MTIDPENDSLESSIRRHSRAIVDLLRRDTPLRVALVLEQQGWPREWACTAIRQLEIQHNPAGLRHGAVANQGRRDRLNLEAIGGATLALLSLAVGVLFLVGGRIAIWAIVGLFIGAGACLRALPELKKHPDRRLPTYTPPKQLRGHQPGDY